MKKNLQEITEELEKIWKERESLHKRKIVLSRGCRTYGYIIDDSTDPYIKLCDDPDCSGCQMIRNAIKEKVKSYGEENSSH